MPSTSKARPVGRSRVAKWVMENPAGRMAFGASMMGLGGMVGLGVGVAVSVGKGVWLAVAVAEGKGVIVGVEVGVGSMAMAMAVSVGDRGVAVGASLVV